MLTVKRILPVIALLFVIGAKAQNSKDTTLRSILLNQLKSTHNQAEWFVPVNNALQDLTLAQATWKPSDSSHSIAQLATHLLFWNKEELNKFNGIKNPDFSGNNEETFSNPDETKWKAAIKELDEVLTGWEKAVTEADEAKLQKWYNIIAHIGTHNAYHTGQIIYIRKQQGSWNPEKGVK
ncbi:DinB family protein [Danxiaibacter flavus]|uniref:DinB family protein n=1 Tax=Danxiaibacter flavus TaxID=3049108 RepID=A0ABV3ZNK2_9BACT|nr:DinB family protein [Chitinophagaceae bacterium DXS]